MAGAYISNIQQFCVHDGPGIRTVVFFMGCPLRCKWCQNPENFYCKPVVMYNRVLCAGCGKCLLSCPRQGAEAKPAAGTDAVPQVNRERCTGCGSCAAACYAGAKTLCGREMSVDEVYRELMKDEMFFRESGGGVTLSGGEATLYPAFCIELLAKLRRAGIHTALETSGYCSAAVLKDMAPLLDLFLFDIKAVTGTIHRQWTGADNAGIKENLIALAREGNRVILRIPLIPGVNDGAEFDRILAFIKPLDTVREIHILPFHQAGSSKYAQSGVGYYMEETPECSAETAEFYAARARLSGFAVNIGGWDCA
jgi:pyruvate formate lyase activating enzyme